ncbi:integrase core domain-containing protein [Hymenobacter sp. BT559]|uniref:integrase core domain-containing protein n=1 Tax=Hymenobacter sp. BT559 TaxID=2795729 RepID=UPI0018ED5B08|nr:transposase [Hymenobacter sp. BT559]
MASRGQQALRSQNRRGDCYDNAQAESLWSRLKTEVLEVHDRPVFADLADAQASVAEYFNYYNHGRLHSSIGYQTLYHTHQQLLKLNALNYSAQLVTSFFTLLLLPNWNKLLYIIYLSASNEKPLMRGKLPRLLR